ncbi:MAG: hypothetical protein P8J87_02410 [Verrucomicrobiales bacterium]|nr:hypothetical protein [Verrucomicrobiales bacterium]
MSLNLAGVFALTLSAQAIEPGWTTDGISVIPETANSTTVIWNETDGINKVTASVARIPFSNFFTFKAAFLDTEGPFVSTFVSQPFIGAASDDALATTVLDAYLAYINDGWMANGREGTWELGTGNALALIVAVDTDGDGVNDNEDACPNSILTETVVIGEIDSRVTNTLYLEDDRRSCTLADLVQACADISENHRDFVHCVAIFADSLKSEDTLTRKEASKLVKAAAKSGRTSKEKKRGKRGKHDKRR